MIRNLTRDTELAGQVVEARSVFSRMRGMLGRRFENFDAMVFAHNNSVHTFFMGIPIDVVFLDGADTVLAMSPNLSTWRMAGCFAGKTTIELPAGILERSATAVGDTLQVVIDQTI